MLASRLAARAADAMVTSARSQQPLVSVVMPALDEERALRAGLDAVLTAADEVIVSDGGSRDGTVALARQRGATVVTGPAGRGPQLNRGAAAARGDVFLFLHADTTLPAGAAASVRQAIAGGACGGAFPVRFDVDRPVYRFGAAMVNWRTRRSRLPLGDQAQFATREAFAEIGGFRDWPILEDLDFARRLKRHGPIAVLATPVVTSARRFEARGPARTVALNWLLWSLFLCGVSPHRLARLYRDVR
jgi:rSAM/selenodomain-associated transferase 2